MFISFEGIDFCGKSTQISLLESALSKAGKEIIIIREPGGTVISEQVRTILLDKKNSGMISKAEMLLFSASRAQLVEEKIIPCLKKGFYVISDRFYDSTTAYQGYGRGINCNFVESLNAFAAGKAIPDITFFLDIPVELAIKRQKENAAELDRIESSTEEFYNRVRAGYKKIAEREKRIVTLDGAISINELHRQILSKVESYIAKNENK